MKINYLVSTIIGVSIAIVQVQAAVALSPGEIGQIAKTITVRIEGQNSRGSGVIIKREGKTYYVLTAAHVVPDTNKYTIFTPDGNRHQIDYKNKKDGAEVDLAIVQFSSEKDYAVAKLGNSDRLLAGMPVYVSGFPVPSSARPNPDFNFLIGNVVANGSQPQPDGYTLVYNNNTRPGISGGAVLNDKGELVGIHGKAETTADANAEIVRTGNNLGIPIDTFVRLALIDVGASLPSRTATAAPTADDFYIQAANKYKQKDYRGAIAAYSEAVKLNPKLAPAYSNRGAARYRLGDKPGAIADYTQAIALNSQLALAYNNRGVARFELGEKLEAVEDFSQAIQLDPQSALAYQNRGLANYYLKKYPAAIGDLSQAIQLDPQLAQAYNYRGLTYYDRGSKLEAVNNFSSAIALNPELAPAYYNRGLVRAELKQEPAAIADFARAIALNPQLLQDEERSDKNNPEPNIDFDRGIALTPQSAQAYYQRGVARYNLGNLGGALFDFNRAIALDDKYADAYYQRGRLRGSQKDNYGAIADFDRAIALNLQAAPAYYHRGLVRYELQNLEAAINDWRRAAGIDRQLPEVRLALAVALYARGDRQESVALARTAIATNRRLADIKFLRENNWGDRLLQDAAKLFKEIATGFV